MVNIFVVNRIGNTSASACRASRGAQGTLKWGFGERRLKSSSETEKWVVEKGTFAVFGLSRLQEIGRNRIYAPFDRARSPLSFGMSYSFG